MTDKFKAPKGTHTRFDESYQEHQLVDDETHKVLITGETWAEFVEACEKHYEV